MSPARLTIALCLLAALSSCLGTLIPVDTPDVKAAKERKDVAWLKQVCDGEMRVKYDMVKYDACQYQKELDATGGATGKTDCGTVVERYKAAPKQDDGFVITMSKEMASCGKYTELFELVAHWGDDGRVLIALDSASLDDEFEKYAKSHIGPSFLNIEHGDHAMRHISHWLEKKRHFGHCESVAEAAKDADEKVRAWSLPYLREAKCKTGIPIAVGLLTSDKPSHRMWACQALAHFGDASVLPKVKILANTDSFHELQEVRGNSGAMYATKVYPVREACVAAAGKIELR